MRLGIGSYAFGWAVGVPGHEPPQLLDENGLIDAASALGLSLVQIGDNLPLAAFDSLRLERLGARAARDGVSLELGGRSLTAANLDAYLTLAKKLNAPLVRFVIDGPGYRPTPEQIVAILRVAAPRLQDGPLLALENHDRLPARTLRAIIEAVAHERVGICLDTANSLGVGEGLGELLAVLAPYTLNLHAKDFFIQRLPHQMGFSVEGRPAGAGMMDLPGILDALAPHGRCRSAILEAWTPPEATIAATIAKERAWAAQSIAYLKPLFSEISSSVVRESDARR